MKPYRIILCLLILFVGCGRKSTDQISMPAPASQSPVVIPQIVEERYMYRGELYRDPFVPVSAKYLNSSILDTSPEGKMPNLGMLSLRGILEDKKEKLATLASPMGSYILRGNRLYDSRNRLVRKISGIIRGRGVTLITEDGFQKTYKLEGIQ